MPELLSGLIVEVPEAEPAVGELRMRLDRSAALGVPAHVTALFPLVVPDLIDGVVLDRIADVARASQPFDYQFSTTGWFGDQVLFLAPDDPTPFRELTAQLWEAFPECPPYGGQFADVVPHLTIGDAARREVLLDAERSASAYGPVSGRAERLTLMAQTPDGRWHLRGRWTLGERSPA